ncbi:MAG: hypothetical protein K940chlam3_00394 [Chlamydiae bacterium]|nr:hypothetical protein [Chlamydiota bacterium]
MIVWGYHMRVSYLLSITLFLSLVSGAYADHKVAYTGLAPVENQEFEDQVDEAIIKDKLKIIKLEEKIADTTKKVPPSLKLELMKAKVNLEMKSKLVKNYVRTTIIQNVKVRRELLRLLNKQSINIEDLIALQKLVNEEKDHQRAIQ